MKLILVYCVVLLLTIGCNNQQVLELVVRAPQREFSLIKSPGGLFYFN
jgi:hypothetical protein